ncbi:MAG TPA: acylphosphatase [Terriglobia bacterium]|nr:acylphosphatase [Terriglobia bacterium]
MRLSPNYACYSPMLKAKHYLVRGRVQGVGYRYFALEAAERWGIRGYVRNLPEGEVEVHAQADESALESFKQELERGPGMARVTEIVENDLPVSGSYSSFLIRG